MSVFPFNEIDRGEYRRLGSDGAVPPTRERSIACNLRIDFGGPGVDAAAQGLDAFESLIAEPGGDVEGALSVMAENREVLVGIEFLMSAGRDVAHGHEGAGFNVRGASIPMVRGHR